ncbi:TPA: aldehyde dehydrogenase family protein [Enterobacter roggenkampii]|nr:aldehyde dehydrogenase family protein [Enterobacter roggenkampii]
MHTIEQIFINGEFVTPHGTERFNLYNPATAQVMGQVRLADEVDAERAIAAAKAAFPAWSRTTKQERIVALKRMHAAVAARHDALLDAIVEEYGAPASRSAWMASYPAEVIAQAIEALEAFEFVTPAGAATVQMTPLGVAGLITPWNSDAGFICGKLAAALAAGCTAVIKPSEMSALQTQIVTEALRNAAESFKRVTLELGGKSPTILLDDVDLEQAIPLVIQAGFMNSGQACVAGTRILVPYSRKAEIETELAQAVAAVKSGDPRSSATDVGPMVSEKQWLRVQGYIRKGIEEGARLLAGGEGRPDGTRDGWFVRPTLFVDVNNRMTIARDEIFGPVLCVIPYQDEAEAIAIANDTEYGLSAMVLGADVDRARRVAQQIVSGRVLVNTLAHEPKAPFGGFKHSGVGREMGEWGIRAFMEPRSMVG